MCACGVRSELMDYQERLRDKKFHARNKAKHGFYATVRETEKARGAGNMATKIAYVK